MKKICVIITDISPQTVYDTFWYPPDCTAATLAAVRHFLEEQQDMEVYYSMNPAKNDEIETFYKPDINPMAGEAPDKDDPRLGSGLASLEARGYEISGQHVNTWQKDMDDDWRTYRRSIKELQRNAWSALAAQDAVKEWANALEGLISILEPLSVSLDFIADLYPPLKDTVEEVKNFVTVLDGVRIIPTSVELAMRLDSLETFGNRAEALYLQAFGLDE